MTPQIRPPRQAGPRLGDAGTILRTCRTPAAPWVRCLGLLLALASLQPAWAAPAQPSFASVADYLAHLPALQGGYYCQLLASQRPDVACPRGVGFQAPGFATSDVFGAVSDEAFRGYVFLLSPDASGRYHESFRTARIDMPNLWVELYSGAKPSELWLRFASGRAAQPTTRDLTLVKAHGAWAVAEASRSVLAHCSDGSIGNGQDEKVNFITGWVTVTRHADCEHPRALRKRIPPRHIPAHTMDPMNDKFIPAWAVKTPPTEP